MFLGFANFYRQFIKSFYKIVALLTLMLKTLAPSVLARPACTKANKNKLGTDSSDRIDNSLANLSSSTKKISSGAGFSTPKANLAFI